MIKTDSGSMSTAHDQHSDAARNAIERTKKGRPVSGTDLPERRRRAASRQTLERLRRVCSGLFSHGLVVAALGGIDLAGLLQFGAGLGHFLGIDTEGLGDVAGTDRLASFFHSVEDFIFHGVLLGGVDGSRRRGAALVPLKKRYAKAARLSRIIDNNS
jgi:hypothetical protein